MNLLLKILAGGIMATAPTTGIVSSVEASQKDIQMGMVYELNDIKQSRHMDACTGVGPTDDDETVIYNYTIDLSMLDISKAMSVIIDISGSKVVSDYTNNGVNVEGSVDISEHEFLINELGGSKTVKFTSNAIAQVNSDGIKEQITVSITLVDDTLVIEVVNVINAFNRGNHLSNTAGKGYGYAGIKEVKVMF